MKVISNHVINIGYPILIFFAIIKKTAIEKNIALLIKLSWKKWNKKLIWININLKNNNITIKNLLIFKKKIFYIKIILKYFFISQLYMKETKYYSFKHTKCDFILKSLFIFLKTIKSFSLLLIIISNAAQKQTCWYPWVWFIFYVSSLFHYMKCELN